jgi:alcohol dehydrogenase, propanol-preferring
MPTYRAFEATGVHNLRLAERELVDPAPGYVRLKVQACGVCHSDVLAVEGLRPDPGRPVVPGHEIVGIIDAVGAGVTAWRSGDRVGVGFLAGHCGECEWCRRGDFVNCLTQQQTGTSTDGGYAEVAYARASGLVRIPDGLLPVEAAPLLCAGLTTFTALTRTATRAGALVAVQGIGGLGHLALQYAHSLGHGIRPMTEACRSRRRRLLTSGCCLVRPGSASCSTSPHDGAASRGRLGTERVGWHVLDDLWEIEDKSDLL